MKLLVVLIIITYQVVGNNACRSAAKARDPSKEEAIAAWDYYIKYAKGFKDVTPRVRYSEKKKEKYGRWLIRYMYKKSKYPPELEWPQPPMFLEWQGWGNGETGQDPPPWALVPNLYGKPNFCLYDIVYGKCKQSFNKYAFDKKKGRCVKFKYSGCGGNENRFNTLLKCQESCGRKMFSYHGCCGNDYLVDKEKVLDTIEY